MLQLRRVPIDTFSENVVYLNKNCSSWKIYEFDVSTRVEIHGGIFPLYASLEIVHDDAIVKPNEVGLSINTFKRINLPEGAEVSISPAPSAPSVDSIKRKVNGAVLSGSEYKAIVNDIVSGRYTQAEIAAFMVANGSFMTAQEVYSLTDAMAGEEDILTWEKEEMIVDHHCIGGVPGNRITLIVVPIIAACGLAIPSVATRAITSSSGVIDAMEVLANIDFDEKNLYRIIEEHRGCIVWNESLRIAPSGDTMLLVEKNIGMSIEQHIVASIISSKVAAGITHLVIDIPVGEGAKIKTMPEAMKIKKLFEYVCDLFSMQVDVVITDGSEPIGNGIGPVLEARDIMKVLRCKKDAPNDLREKALFIAGRILEFDSNLRGGEGYYTAREMLDSGRALETMNRIIHAQGRTSPPMLGHLTRDVCAENSGVVESISNKRISRIAALSGAPRDKGAGIDLLKKTGDFVERGEPLYRIHASRSTDFAFANGYAEADSGYEIIIKSNKN
ncbi:MAG: thymidine phosphorylase family protein [Alphaproteobacteria bacterium]